VPLLSRILALIPPTLLRRIGRSQWRGPVWRHGVQLASRWLRRRDVTIAHGHGKGLRFNAGGANPGYALGTSEPHIQDVLARLLRPGAVFWDVGANVGFFTVIAARLVGEAGHVVAVEPVPENLDALAHNVALNRLQNVTVIPRAAAVDDRQRCMEQAGEPTWARVVADDAPRPADHPLLAVQAIRLDDVASSFAVPEPDVVKIDVEGLECSVVHGMAALLRRRRPTIVCELHGTAEEFLALMASFHYRTRSIRDDHTADRALWHSHVLATPDDSPLETP
jgi:FkbM family methyltransferase